MKRSSVFSDLLGQYQTKLPSTDAVAGRLENEMEFNREKAKKAAEVLEKSLRYAGVLGGSNTPSFAVTLAMALQSLVR